MYTYKRQNISILSRSWVISQMSTLSIMVLVQHLISLLIRANCKLYAYIVQSIYESYWHNLKQIATEFFSAGIHSGEVSLKHTKNLWRKQVKSAINVTFSH